MKSERIRFPGATGAELAGRLDLPTIEPAAYALFAHCFTCSKDLKAVGGISRALVERGIAVLRFDFTGLGESEGDFADTDFSSNLDDLEAAAGWLREKHRAPSVLIGHSLGGAAVLAVAERIPEAVAVATIGAPSEPSHLREMLVRRAPELSEDGGAEDGGDSVEIELAGRSFTIRRQLLDDLEENRLRSAIGGLERALLILHSPVDTVVPVDHAAKIFTAARHPKSYVSLDQADHLLTDPRDSRYVGEVLASWAGRYVETAAPAGAVADRESEQGWVTVRGGFAGYTQSIRVRRHRMIGDEPHAVGGADRGPTPYEYLLAGLGACTSMTLRMYADRKGWPLEATAVALRHSRVHKADCEDCGKGDRLDRIERRLELAGPLDEEQRTRLAEIADRCPVHRTLTGKIEIETELVEEEA